MFFSILKPIDKLFDYFGESVVAKLKLNGIDGDLSGYFR